MANGGAEVTFTATRAGKATVAISLDEKTMNVSIQDAMGRSVFQGVTGRIVVAFLAEL